MFIAVFIAVRTLLSDTGQIVRENFRFSLMLTLSLVLQVIYWTVGSPGPRLLGGAARDLGAALSSILWAALLLLVVPLVLMRLLGAKPAEAGLRLGDVRFGLRVCLGGGVIAAFALALGATDPALQATYPWSGNWPGRSLLHAVGWAALYSLYYLAFEFFYRGFTLWLITPQWGQSAALWLQVATSTLIHVGKPLSETVSALPIALVFAVFALRSRSVLWPTLLHLIIGLSTDFFSLLYQGELQW